MNAWEDKIVVREGFGGKIGGKERGNNKEWRGGNTCIRRKWG